jgi:ABC-type spermidine/putrescine transport system permease subunit II
LNFHDFQGKTVVKSIEKVLQLPMVVPSVFVAVGTYEASMTYTAKVKGTSEDFLTHIMSYQVKNV